MATTWRAHMVFSTFVRTSLESIRRATLRQRRRLLKIRSAFSAPWSKVNTVTRVVSHDHELTASLACRAERSSGSLRAGASAEQCRPKVTPGMEANKLNNLWNVYQRAKFDYLLVANDMSRATARAARFLRDTAENMLSYFENK